MDEPAAEVPIEVETESPARVRRRRLWRMVVRILPFVSLVNATISAVSMRRSTGRAQVVAAGALVGWVLVMLAVVYIRRIGAEPTRRQRIVRYSVMAASQAAVQQALAFPLPFFVASLAAVHVVFVLLYVLVMVLCFWDPYFARLARVPSLFAWVQGFAAFTSLVVVLPMLGMANVPSLVIAGGGAALAVPMAAWLRGDRHVKRWAVAAALVGAVVVLAPLVPPAPLSMGRATFATGVQARAPTGGAEVFTAPPNLYCFTAIRAPLGLHDRLFHVWQLEGREVMRIELDVRGNQVGYATWSRYRAPSAGHWRCIIETALGQRLGDVHALVLPGKTSAR